MIAKQKLAAFWNSFDVNSVSATKELFSENIDVFLEFLIDKISDKEKFEIGFIEEGRQSSSTLMYKESQKEIELRLKKNSQYEFVLTIEHTGGEKELFKTKLSDDKVKLIPENIRKQMYSVREIERPTTFLNAPTE